MIIVQEGCGAMLQCAHLVKEREIYQYSIAPGLPYTDATEMQPHELCYR